MATCFSVNKGAGKMPLFISRQRLICCHFFQAEILTATSLPGVLASLDVASQMNMAAV